MIDFSDNAFFGTTLRPGTVYYFKSPRLRATNEPHYFIVVHNSDSDTIIICCTTTKIEKCVKYIELNKIPESTLVFIKPDGTNGLTKDSMVNCNTNCFRETEDDLRAIRHESGIEVKGTVPESIIEQLRKGIMDSPVVEEEIKDILISK